jgi:hypothetical protein
MSNKPASRHPPTGDSLAVSTGLTASASASPSRPPSTSGSSLLSMQAQLTSRDLTIADWLDRHGVLTTTQITAAFFTSPTTASHRLAKLRAVGLLDRFHRPHPGGGFGPWHWVIGALGVQITTAARGVAPPAPRSLRARHARLVDSAKLPHLLGTNQFFVDLHAHARTHPGNRLVRWWSEPETHTRYGGRIQPDGHGLWRDDDITIGLFLEYDRGSEDLRRLVRKLAAYDQLAGDGGPAYPVLFWLHSRHREDNLHAELARHRLAGRVPVATAARDSAAHPAGRIWSLVGEPGRHSLGDLPFDHGNAGSLYAPNLHDPDLDPEL